ncbi:MAG: hypothetical protein K6A44_04550 [bacterium]|nr:hypothetical protein [bacterium]
MLLLTNKTIDKLKYDLVREGLVDYEALNFAQDNAQKNLTNLSVELVKEGIISEKELLNFIQNKLHIPYVELSDYVPDIECLKYVNPEDAKRYNIFPLFKIEDVLTIAMSDPLDLFTINNLFEPESFSIEPVVCAQDAIADAVECYYFSKKQPVAVESWQDAILAGDLEDESVEQVISSIIKNAIAENRKNIFMERAQEGLRVYFDKDVKGLIPNILAPRFINSLAGRFLAMDAFDEDVPQNSKFDFKYKNLTYSLIISFLPTKFGARISLEINKPPADLPEDFKNRLSLVVQSPSFVGVQCVRDDFIYSVAQYLGESHSVLMAESCVKYNIAGITQLETGKNTGLYFDEIIKQVEFQNFEILFWEKIYIKEQFEKLKLLSKERTIFTSAIGEDIGEFDFVIDKDGVIS